MSDVKKLRPIPIPKNHKYLTTRSSASSQRDDRNLIPVFVSQIEAYSALAISFTIYNILCKYTYPEPSYEEKLNYMDGSIKTPDSQEWMSVNLCKDDFINRFHHQWEIVAKAIWKWPETRKPGIEKYPNVIYKIYSECINNSSMKPITIKQADARAKRLAKTRANAEERRLKEANAREKKEAIARGDFEPQKTADYLWNYKGYVYEVTGFYTDEEAKLLILEEVDKERRYFEKLRLKFSNNSQNESTSKRPRIPEKVRIEVWRRDGGKCARCGSREYLEYDHIVPISKGGSNTARNIELLCEKCNRNKSNNVV